MKSRAKINQLINEVRRELADIGIEVDRNIPINISNRMTRCFGIYEYSIRYGKLVEKITLSSRLVQDGVPDNSFKSVLIHEYLHSLARNDGHLGEWKRLADKVNKAYKGVYNIQRCDSEEHLKIQAHHKYTLRCKKCGELAYADRWSNFVARPYLYSHRGCGGKFEQVKVDDPRCDILTVRPRMV